MTAVTVQLPDDAKSFVEQQVASGHFATPGDFILSLVEEARRRTTAIERVDQLLLEGLSSGSGEEATPEWWARTRQEWRNSPGRGSP